ncbi:MAG TPA: carbohydrate-binding domain-containing protein [Polyangiaceae bacterium]|nr:carbohydrate-binding domain-containing protein [Polyangiaceae bacterium]
MRPPSLDIVRATMNKPAHLSQYINGAESQSISLPTTGSWSTTHATKKVTVTIPQGATLKLQLDAGDASANLDYIQVD